MRASLLLLLVLGSLLSAQTNPNEFRVIAMPTQEDLQNVGRPMGLPIDESFLREWRRLRNEAVSAGARIIVLEVHTPGGDVNVANQVIADLRNLRDAEGIRTIAYVPRDATSAGAMIALACKELVMAPGATIGNVIPLELKGWGGLEEAPRKWVSHIVGTMKGLAQAGGFNELLLESMVDPDKDVWAMWGAGGIQVLQADDYERITADLRSRGQRVNGIQLSAPNQAYVFAAGQQNIPDFERVFPHITCGSREQLPIALGLRQEPTQSSEVLKIPAPPPDFFRAIFAQVNWSILLLILGIGFFIAEFNTPGLGLFGVLGILSLIGYFWVNAGTGMPVAFSLALLLLGFMLLLAELLIIPGFGVAGISGIALILFSIYASTVDLGGETLRERLLPDTPGDWILVRAWLTKLLGSSVLSVGAALLILRNLHHIPFVKGAFIEPPPALAHDSLGVTSSGRVLLQIGARGVALTVLRPSGKAHFGAGDVDVVSDGEFIASGSPVEVILVEGHRVVVRAGAQNS
jgi:membrane-bound serine protease (ClpP class)